MKLKFKKHYYGDSISEYEIEVPDDIVFVHVEGDIGQILHEGFGHYLGGSKILIEQKGLCCHIYKNFPDVYLYEFNNVTFESNITIISSEKFTSKFELNKCYVITKTKDGIKDIRGKSYKQILDGDYELINGRLVSISKILNVRSQNLIDIMTVTVSSWIDFDDSEVKMITLNKGVSIDRLADDNFNKIEIKKDANKEFTEALNQVLNIINKSVILVVSDQPSLHGENRSVIGSSS